MAGPKWCNLCNRNVIPGKKFNWILFLFLCLFFVLPGFFYLIYYLMKQNKCPICSGDNFGPARAAEMGK